MSNNTAPTLSSSNVGNTTNLSAPPQDTTAPTLTTISIASNNSTKTNYAGENDVVTLTLVADETLSTVNVTFKSGGQAVTNAVSYSGSGDSWTAQYTVSSSDTSGIVSFAITIEDSAFNSTINFDSSTTTDSSSVTKLDTVVVDINESTQSGLQLGNDIDGESSADNSGHSVSLSSDGTIVAIGAPYNDGAGGNSGHVRVYQYSNSAWTQLGDDIDGENVGDFSAYSISLSSDGTILAIGAYLNDGSTSNAGHVRVYQYSNSVWTKLGNDIDGVAVTDDWSGYSVALNDDGTIVIIGAPKHDNAGATQNGHARVYQFSNSAWTQMGNDIDGDRGANWGGYAVSINSDGSIVALSDPYHDDAGGDSGRVRVYQYVNSDWTQLGEDIDGENTNDWSGMSISLSSDGTIIAIGARMNDGSGTNSNIGHVRVYQYINSTWTKLGDDINGESSTDQSGYSVSLSSDGSIVAIGAPYNNGGGSDSGHVRIYEYSNSNWTQLGIDINGISANEYSGWSVSLSSNGSIVAVGAPNSTSGTGKVRIFETGNPTTTQTTYLPIPPDVTSLTIASNNSNSQVAILGDEITLSFEYDMAINTPIVSFQSNGQDIADTIDIVGTNDTIWTAKYTVNEADQQGAITFTVDASSKATNANATQLTENDITNGSSVTVDYTPPTFTDISMNSNTSVTVTFSEDVFTNADGTGDLTASDFSITITGGNATFNSINSVSKTSNSEYVLNLLLSGVANGEELVRINVASDTSIYDIAGNAMLQIDNIPKVYPPSTLTTTTTNTGTQLSGTITGESYGNGDYTITSDIDNVTTVSSTSQEYPPSGARGNFNIVSDGTTYYEGTVSGQSYGNGTYTISSTHSSSYGLDILYTNDGTASGSNRLLIGTTGLVTLTFTFPESFICESFTTKNNHSATNLAVYAYNNGVLLGTIFNSSISNTTNYVTFNMDTTNNYSGNEIRIGLSGGTKVYYQNDYFHFNSKSFTSTTGNNLNNLYDTNIDVGNGLYILSTNTPTLTFTFPNAFVLNNIYTANNDCAQTWVVKAFDGDTELEELYNDTVSITSGELDVTIPNTNNVNSNKYTLRLSNPQTGIDYYQNTEFKFTGTNLYTGINNTYSLTLDVEPLISSTSINSDNTELTVTFSEDVFTNSDGTGDLTASDFSVTIIGGTAELYSINSVTKTNNSEYILNLTYSRGASGAETITVVPASSTSIYDDAGQGMSTTQTNNTATLNDTRIAHSSASISSNNTINSSFATYYTNDIVTLTIVSEENIGAATISFKSGGVSVNNSVTTTSSGNTHTAQYVVSSSDTTGIITFTVDLLGLQIVGTTDRSKVEVVGIQNLIDANTSTTSEGPSIFISNVSISSNNTTSSNVATSDGNNEITLTITALYDITQPTVTFQTGGVDISGNVTVSGSGKDYTASFIADRVDNLGDVTFSITNYEHNSVAGGEIINTTDGSKVKLVGKRFAETTRASVANTQLGGDFIGIDNEDEKLGKGVAINGDGSIIAMSSPGNDEVNSSQGKVDVFKYDYVNASWNIMGSSIRPIHFGIPDTWSFGNYRSSISLDENGTTLAMFAESTSDTTVYIVIVKYDGTDWTQLGSTITLSKTIGENMNLKLNSFGHHLIIGLESNNSAYVYRYNGYYWFQLGSTITSENTYSELQFGYSVAINSTGNRILVGSNPTGSYTSNYSNIIYEYRASQWVKAHEFSLKNQGSDNGWGCSVDMSSDGNTISIGGAYSPDSWPNYSTDPSTGDPVYSTGVIILQYDGSSWNQLGNKITSTNDSSWGFGTTHSLSKDGTVILVGEPDAEDESSNSNVGRVYVYQYDGSSTWNQVGSTYIGKGHVQSDNVQLAKYLGLSADGTTMMVGASGYDITGSTSDDHGLVQVFETGCGNKTIFDKIDNIIPEFNTLTLSSTATYSQYAGEGDTITLSIVTDVSVNSPTVSFTTGGNDISGNVTLTGSETTWTASFVVDAADSLGVVGFSAQVSSLDNIEGLITNTTTDNTGFTIVGSVFVSGVVPTTVTTTSNLQIGNSIVGKAASDYSGSNDCLSLNKDGSVVAIGAIFNDDNGDGSGHVRVWKRDTNAAIGWIQIGQDIVGSGLRSGACSINDDGNIVAIGAYWNSDSATFAGHVRIWQYNGTDTWNQIGQSITGDNQSDQAGEHLSINSDGTIVAFALPGQKSGKVYQYNGTDTWSQIGQTITYTNSVDAISLSSDGNRLAISEMNDSTNGSNSGCTRVWEYNGTDTWNQIGQDIVGENNNDKDGWSISLSGDGNRIGIRSNEYLGGADTGRDRIWEYNGSDTWNQIGQDIVGENTGDGMGGEIALNYDGSVFATGLVGNDGNHSNAGFVRVYQYNGTDTWNKIGTDYDGLADSDYSGRSVSISNDGHIIAIGADGNDDNGNSSGHVRIYETGLSGTVMGDGYVRAIPPTITSLTISSNNTENTKYAGENDVVTLNIVADVNMNEPTVSFTSGGVAVAGAVTYTGSDTSWTAQYTVNSADTLGTVAFTVDYSSASTSTSGSQATSTTDGSEITILNKVDALVTITQVGTAGLQLGSDIDGEAADDRSGNSVSLSSDGTIVAIGAIYNDGTSGSTSDNRGHVRVYQYSNSAWTQLGSDIDGEAEDDRSGHYVSLSSDGTIVAIGADRNDSTSSSNTKHGHVRVYQYSNSAWTQLGADIDGEAAYDYSGKVSLSSDGTILAIGAYWNDGTSGSASDNRGHVRVYQYSNSTWTQLGADIDGEAADDRSGNSVSLSSDGSIVAIGAPHNDGTSGILRGHVRVYQYSNSAWTQLGSDIDGEAANDYSGYSVSLSSDGSIVAIGAIYNDGNGDRAGHVRIYQYSNSTWTQLGSDINGEAATDYFGYSVSLSSDGTLVAIGAYGNDGNGSDSGHVRIYQYSNSAWTQLGADIDGEAAGDYSGYSVSLSGDGAIVAIGAYANNSLTGHVRVFETGESRLVTTTGSVLAIPPTITSLTISSNNTENTKYAGENDVVTLNIVADININQPTVTFTSGGAAVAGAVTYTGSDTSWTAQYTVNSTDTLGSVAFTVDYSSASTSTSGSQAISTTNGSEITILDKVNVLVTNTEPTTEGLQLGDDIDGEAVSDLSGYSVSSSSDGTIVAIGAMNNDGYGSLTGHVRVYQYSNSTWTQLGSDIDGEAGNDRYGVAVSLSDDGTIMAAGAMYNSGNGSSAGHVRVWQRDESAAIGWTQLGDDIDGEAANDLFGTSVSLSSDGSIVAIGGRYNDGNGNLAGNARVYQYSNSAWTQLGSDIDGEAANDYSGWSVSLSSDGAIVAIGSPNNDGAGNNSGHVRVWQRDESAAIGWTQLGDDIDGEAASDESGYSVSLNDDGSIVAIGAYKNDGTDSDSGHVRVYQYSNSAWTQLGADIDGEDRTDYSGYSVSLSSDGSIVAIGAKYNDGNGQWSGHVRIYQYSNSAWTQLGNDYDGEAAYDESGWSVSLSSDGAIVAIGALRNNGDNGGDSGHVRVFETGTPKLLTTTVGLLTIPPTITSLTISSNNSVKTTVAVVDDVVTLVLVTDININQPTVSFTSGGVAVTGAITYTGSDNSWTAQYTVNSGDTAGEIGFTVDYSSASTSTSGPQATSVTDGKSVNVILPTSMNTTVTTVTSPGHQLGDDIDGEAAGDYSGSSISFNSDGSIVAIGALYNDGLASSTSDNRGHVRIYQYSNSAWTQLGADIDGEASDDRLGGGKRSVSLSSDGTIVAIGALNNTGSGPKSGHARVYQYSNSAWTKLGDDINGESSYDYSGYSVSLSDDGSIVAIGAYYNDGGGSNSGHVRIYQYSNSAWTQLGADIDGEAADDESGYEVSLSSDGSIVAIGAPKNDGTSSSTSDNRGHVRIYQYSNSAWTQLGADIDGEAAYDESGTSVSLSSDGTIVAIGAYGNDANGGAAGHVRIYQYSNSAWTQLGADIDGEDSGDMSGWSVSLSSDGTIVAIGGYYNDDSASNAGHVRIYQYSNLTWTQLGSDIDGEASGDISGYSVSLSSDGSIVAIGAIWNDGTGNFSGHVRVFETGASSINEQTINVNQIPPEVTNLSVSTSNSNSSLAITNDMITINLETDVSLSQIPSFQLKSGGIDLSGNVEIIGSDFNWVANYVVEEEATNGAFTFVIDVSGTEYADNQFTQANITNGSSVSIVTSPIPRISSVSVSNNNNARITFSEDVYTTNAGAGDLQVTDFELTILTGYATLSSSTPLAITKNSGTEYDLSFSAVVGDGHSDILVDVTNDSSIFNLNGLPLDAGYASNNIAVLGDNFISNLSLSSNSIYNSKYAQPGDIVNLDIKALKPILQPTVVFKSDNETVNNSVVYTGSDVSWNASYTVHTNDTSGNVTFTINYTDLESNSGIESTSTTDNTSVTIVPDIFQIAPEVVGLTHTYTQSANNSSQGKNYVSTGDSYVIYAEFIETLGSLPVINISIGGNSIAQSGYIMDTITQYTNPVAEQYNENNDKQYRWNFDIEQYMGDGDITYTIDVSYSYMKVTHTNDEITDSSVFTFVRNGPIYESVVDVGLNGLRVTFNKDVFTESDGTGDLVINTFEFAQYGNSGTLYLNSLYPTSVTKVTNSVYDLSYDMVGELENNTSAFLVAVFKRTAALIYDDLGLLFTTPYKGSAFLYDSTVVSLTSVSIASDNSSKTMFASYYTNDTVTLSFTSSESLYVTPVVSFTAGGADISGNVTVSGSGTTWTASYLVDQVDTLGLVGFTIDFTDGYNSQQVTATTDNSKVTTVGTFTGELEVTQRTVTTVSTTQVGDTKFGNADSNAGWGIAISGDGTKMAVPAFSNDYTNTGSNTGAMQLWQYNSSTQVWDTYGSDGTRSDGFIYGKQSGGFAGRGYAMNEAGDIVALGEPYNNQNGSGKGLVCVYKYNSTNNLWEQIGGDIFGDTNNEQSGFGVSLNDIGNIIAIGAWTNDEGGTQNDNGVVRVFKYTDISVTNGTWEQLGGDNTGDIYGEVTDEFSGWSVSLNSAGDIVAIGAYRNDSQGTDRGVVRVWKYSDISVTNGTWTKLGGTNGDIFGEQDSEESGYNVSLNDIGNILAFGAHKNGNGEVRVYKYSDITDTNGSWTKLSGNSIVGEYTGEQFGYQVSLNGLGDMVAVGAWWMGNAYVYQYTDISVTDGTWNKIFQIQNNNSSTKFGSGIALNKSGEYVAIGNYSADSGAVYETGAEIIETVVGIQTVPAIPPVISSLGILSNNTLSTSHATDGNTITVSMTYDENLTQSPTVTFQSGGLDVALSTTISGSDATYTAEYIVDPNDTQGDVTFVIDASGTLADTNDTQLEITDGSSMEMLDSGPFFVSVTNEINKNISIEFNTDVYNTNTVSGDLETSDFVLAVESGDVTLTSTTPSAISKVSNKIYDLSFSLTETVTTNVPIISINPVDSTSIYNSVGFAMIAPQTTDNSFNLIDRLPPSLTSVSISSNNTYKTKYASYFAPDTVTLTLTASENINQPVVTFTVDDVPVTDTINYSGSGASWTVSFVVTSSTPLGNLSFSIDYTDTTDGNAGTTVTSTTNATKMIIVEAVVTSTSTVQSDNFEQYGQTLFGPASSGDRYFFSADINNDGTIMVTSNYYTLDPVYGDNFYNVVVYELDGASWTQKGSTLYQSSTSLASENSGGNNQFGYSVSINSTGDIIAIGEDAYESQTNANNSSYSWGAVHIFQYDGSDWIQMGNSIVSSTEKSNLGTYVKLSSDGLTLIANSSRYPDFDFTGRVEIYTYNSSNTTWELKGNAIEGETTGERFGFYIDQTSDCLTFAASSYFYKNAESVIIGKVEVYTYNAVDNSFNQVGQTIYGTDGNSRIYFPAISNDGTVLVTGRSSDDTPETNAGTVIVYKYDGTSWNQMGQTLYGTNENDYFGVSIACNADGSQILIGARTDENYTDTGSVSLYKYDGTSWNLVSILHGTRQNQYAHYITTNNSFEYLVLNTSVYKPDGTNMDGILETFKLSETTVNQGYVLYPPDATAVTVDSNGAHGTSVGVGETVSINIDFDDIVYDLSNISILIDDVSINNPFTITPDPPAKSFTISFVISESDPSGNITFSMDASGAFGVNTITHNLITDGSSMETDFTLPVFTGSVSTSTQLNNFDPTYLQGFLDISGAGIRMQNDSKLFIGGDVSLAGNMFIDSTNSVKINTTENNAGYSLDVAGNTDFSGNVTIAGDIDVSGNVVGMVNYNTINKDIPPISNSAIDYSDSTDETALPVGIKVMTSDNSFNSTTATIHNDLSANGNFGSTFIFDNSLSVAGSVLVSDLSQNSYGAYTIYSKKDSSDSFMVGKSASNVFTIVNQSNVGVFMNSDSNVLTSTSDKNLKTNISNLENNSDNIMKLRPVEFNWNYEEDNKKKHVGFIAQEVEEIFPELVEENVYPNGEVYKGVNTNKLIPYMIDEIKLLEEKLEKLEKIK